MCITILGKNKNDRLEIVQLTECIFFKKYNRTLVKIYANIKNKSKHEISGFYILYPNSGFHYTTAKMQKAQKYHGGNRIIPGTFHDRTKQLIKSMENGYSRYDIEYIAKKEKNSVINGGKVVTEHIGTMHHMFSGEDKIIAEAYVKFTDKDEPSSIKKIVLDSKTNQKDGGGTVHSNELPKAQRELLKELNISIMEVEVKYPIQPGETRFFAWYFAPYRSSISKQTINDNYETIIEKNIAKTYERVINIASMFKMLWLKEDKRIFRSIDPVRTYIYFARKLKDKELNRVPTKGKELKELKERFYRNGYNKNIEYKRIDIYINSYELKKSEIKEITKGEIIEKDDSHQERMIWKVDEDSEFNEGGKIKYEVKTKHFIAKKINVRRFFSIEYDVRSYGLAGETTSVVTSFLTLIASIIFTIFWTWWCKKHHIN